MLCIQLIKTYAWQVRYSLPLGTCPIDAILYIQGVPLAIKAGISLTLRRLTSYIYGAPIIDVSRSHTTTQHSR